MGIRIQRDESMLVGAPIFIKVTKSLGQDLTCWQVLDYWYPGIAKYKLSTMGSYTQSLFNYMLVHKQEYVEFSADSVLGS